MSAVTPSSEIALGAEIARLQNLLEEVGANKQVEDALAGRGCDIRTSMRSAIQRRRSASGMCMNSTPMVPQ